MSNKPTILVTGGAGYIGSHTILSLLEASLYHVISADNFSNSGPETFGRIEEVSRTSVKNYPVDLRDPEKTRRIFSENPGITAIIHFAAMKSVPESVEKPEFYRDNNNNSLAVILSCMKEFKVRDLIFSSSCSVYGNVTDQPVDENTPLNKAESPYGETKQECEEMCKQFCLNEKEFRIVALRYFNPVGAHPSGKIGEIQERFLTNLVPILCKVASGVRKEVVIHGADYPTRDGTCVRDYVHVCDIARAHVLAFEWLTNGNVKGSFNIFNLGFGNGITVKEAIDTFENANSLRLNKSTGSRRAGDVAVIYSKANKAKSVLGWEPRFSLDEMMRTAWIWEKHHTSQ